LLAVARELLASYPDSQLALVLELEACDRLANFDEWDKLIREKLAKHPDEPDYLRMQARLALRRGDALGARKILKGLIDAGKASNSDLNEFAWYALIAPAKVDGEAVEVAERANTLSKNASFDIMHTLACLYTEQGRPKEAYQLLVKAIDAAGLEEPN